MSSPSAEPSVMRMVNTPRYSPAMVRDLPDDGMRYETIHGELLVTPAPRRTHQLVVKRLLVALDAYCEATGVGAALMSPADISLTPDSLVQPDVFVHPPVTDPNVSWEGIGRPLLVAEVLSPSTARADRTIKRRHFQETGVPVYWIVDADQRQVEVWTPAAVEPVIECDMVTWAPLAGSEPMRLPLARLFG